MASSSAPSCGPFPAPEFVADSQPRAPREEPIVARDDLETARQPELVHREASRGSLGVDVVGMAIFGLDGLPPALEAVPRTVIQFAPRDVASLSFPAIGLSAGFEIDVR